MGAVAFSAGAATALAAWQLVPQVVKLRRVALPAGLSPTWALLGISTNLVWIAYRWSQGLWLGLPSPVIAGALYVVTLALIARAGPDLRWAGVAGGVWWACIGAAGLVGGWPLLGAMLGVSSGLQAAPSIWAAFRSARPVGIAPSLWAIGLVQGLLWGYYGWAHEDSAMMVYAAATASAAFLILSRYGYARRRTPSVSPDVVVQSDGYAQNQSSNVTVLPRFARLRSVAGNHASSRSEPVGELADRHRTPRSPSRRTC